MIKKIFYILILSLIGANLALADDPVFTTYPTHTTGGNKWLVRDVRAGESYEESLTVKNLSIQPITLNLQVLETSGTQKEIKVLDNQPFRNIGNWLKPEVDAVNLAANEQKEIKLKISVPQDAKEGEYQAAVMVSHLAKSSTGIDFNTRIGNRVYLTVTHAVVLQTNTFNLQVSIWQIALIVLSLLGLFYGLKPLKLTNQKKPYDR